MIDDKDKIEKARESYSVKLLKEKLNNEEDNKIRKDKLNKIWQKIEQK